MQTETQKTQYFSFKNWQKQLSRISLLLGYDRQASHFAQHRKKKNYMEYGQNVQQQFFSSSTPNPPDSK